LRIALTIRKRIAQILRETEVTTRDISRMLGIREKEALEHLPHVQRSEGNSVSIIAHPAECLDCGFVFKKRKRFTTPSRCPVCKSEHTSPPIFAIKENRGKRGKSLEQADSE